MIIETLIVALVAAAPLSELRGAIPLGLHFFRLNPALVAAAALLGNFLPVLVIAYFLDPLLDLIAKIVPWFHRFLAKHLEAARHKTKKAVEKYGLWGLVVFVAIPLPLFGAYTGAAGAVLLGMPRRRIFLASALGILIADAVVFAIDAGVVKLT
jgi:uncharacterized membrane protein